MKKIRALISIQHKATADAKEITYKIGEEFKVEANEAERLVSLGFAAFVGLVQTEVRSSQ